MPRASDGVTRRIGLLRNDTATAATEEARRAFEVSLVACAFEVVLLNRLWIFLKSGASLLISGLFYVYLFGACHVRAKI